MRKKYWKPEKKVIETLAKEYAESVKEVGLACCDHTCNNPLLTKFTGSVLASVPGLMHEVNGFMKAQKSMQKAEDVGAGGSTSGRLVPARNLLQRAEKKEQREEVKQKGTAPDGKSKKVQGYEMKEVELGGASSAPIPYLFLAGFLVFISLIAWGWRKRGQC